MDTRYTKCTLLSQLVTLLGYYIHNNNKSLPRLLSLSLNLFFGFNYFNHLSSVLNLDRQTEVLVSKIGWYGHALLRVSSNIFPCGLDSLFYVSQSLRQISLISTRILGSDPEVGFSFTLRWPRKFILSTSPTENIFQVRSTSHVLLNSFRYGFSSVSRYSKAFFGTRFSVFPSQYRLKSSWITVIIIVLDPRILYTPLPLFPFPSRMLPKTQKSELPGPSTYRYNIWLQSLQSSSQFSVKSPLLLLKIKFTLKGHGYFVGVLHSVHMFVWNSITWVLLSHSIYNGPPLWFIYWVTYSLLFLEEFPLMSYYFPWNP